MERQDSVDPAFDDEARSYDTPAEHLRITIRRVTILYALQILLRNQNASMGARMHWESWPAKDSKLCSVIYPASAENLLVVWPLVLNTPRRPPR